MYFLFFSVLFSVCLCVYSFSVYLFDIFSSYLSIALPLRPGCSCFVIWCYRWLICQINEERTQEAPWSIDRVKYYWVTQKLPQICTVILRICIGKVARFVVYICGYLWTTQYIGERIVVWQKRRNFYTVILKYWDRK